MKRPFFIGILVFFLMWGVSSSWSYTISFSDDSVHWPSWPNRTSDDDKDVIGHPDLYGGTVEIEDGYLKKITINFETWQSGWSYEFTDFFIDTDADSYWDYVVKLYTFDHCQGHGTTSGGEYKVYAIDVAESSNDSYIMSYWGSGGYRENHPIALKKSVINNSNFIGNAYFSGVSGGDNSTYIKFSGLNIALGEQFIIAWQVQCANDVIYQKIGNPIPEPATFLLLGAGLLGLGGLRQRRKGS